MKVFKQSSRVKPKISLILLDWSVRESFHLLHYLSLQNIPRNQFEVVIIEYYSRRSEAIEKFEEQVDTWIALEMSEDLYYHKHLMYNAGIVASTGEICIICDSDAMAKPTFLESVIKAFEQDPNLILHLDQFRNNRKDLYPFCYPSFDDVTGPGCINIKNGKTTGLAVTEDLIHNRNYGACFCAKREDLIKIGGADEHIDFIGHICGPYDFTFRLMNIGKKEVWHETEFLYHTWHPGQAGENNYLGPHDGRHVSTTSLEALTSKRVSPHVINPAIAKLQKNSFLELKDLEQDIILPDYETIAKISFLKSKKSREWAENTYLFNYYRGFVILKNQDTYNVYPKSNLNFENIALEFRLPKYSEKNLSLVKKKIKKNTPSILSILIKSMGIIFWINIINNQLTRILRRKGTAEVKVSRSSIRYSEKMINLLDEYKFLQNEFEHFGFNLINVCKSQLDSEFNIIVDNDKEFYFVLLVKLILNIKQMRIFRLLPKEDFSLNLFTSDKILLVTPKAYIQNISVFLEKKGLYLIV